MTPNPQAENGHVDIANEIVEALCTTQLSGYESRILWALFRKTYGWHKKEDRISLSQFQELTGLPIPKISNTLKRLVLRKMVSVTENGKGKTKSYCFQKVYTLWRDLPEKVIPKMAIAEKGITENRSKGLPISASTKETLTKEKESLPKKNPSAPTRLFSDWFSYAFEITQDYPYHFDGGKDGQHLAYMLKAMGDPKRLVAKACHFLADPDRFPKNKAPTISFLRSKFNEYPDHPGDKMDQFREMKLLPPDGMLLEEWQPWKNNL